MFDLDGFSDAPFWIDLPRGVRVQVRPLDSTVVQAAQAAAARRVREITEAQAAAAEANAAADPSLPDLSDADFRAGYIAALIARYLARYGIIAWEGIEQPFTPSNAERLMAYPAFSSAFLDKYEQGPAAVSAEGNASAPAPDGSSAGAQDIAADASLSPAEAAPAS